MFPDLLKGCLQSPTVYLPGKMHRAFGIDRVPARRIGGTEELGIEADLSNCIRNRDADHPFCRFPGGATGRPPQHHHLGNLPVFDYNFEFGGAESLAIGTKTILPWQPASGRGGHDPFSDPLLARRYYRDPLFDAHKDKIVGQVLMPEKIQHQIGLDCFRQIDPGVVEHRRQGVIDRDNLQGNDIGPEFPDPGDLPLTAAVLLKDDHALQRLAGSVVCTCHFPVHCWRKI